MQGLAVCEVNGEIHNEVNGENEEQPTYVTGAAYLNKALSVYS